MFLPRRRMFQVTLLSLASCALLLVVGCPQEGTQKPGNSDKKTAEKPRTDPEKKSAVAFKPPSPAKADEDKALRPCSSCQTPDFKQPSPAKADVNAKSVDLAGEQKKEDAVTEKKVELADEEKKESDIKVDLSYLEKKWGIKCKSHKIDASPGYKKVTFLLEFTKEVENLEELRAAFVYRVQNRHATPKPNPPLWFYFFDEDNVFVFKSHPLVIEGEVSGKKGDAIRVSIAGIQPWDFAKIRKIEARPAEKEKDKASKAKAEGLADKQNKEEAIKVDMSFLEKTWGIKCNSCKITPPKPIEGRPFTSPATVKFLLEFTKDVENLKELQEAFEPYKREPGKQLPYGRSNHRVARNPNPHLWFYFFDEDNVFVYKSPYYGGIEGKLTGKKGDAFWINIIGIPETHFKKTRKIAIRPGEKDKDKDKEKKDKDKEK